MKSRFLILTMGLLMVLAIGADAYAQAVFTVSGSNRPRGRMNGHGELAGGITLAKLSGQDTGGEVGSVIIDYGVPVTNDVGDGANTITVDICGTLTAAADALTDVDDNTVTITVAANHCTGPENAIDVSGVLLSLVGSGQESIVATVTSTGGVRLPSGSNMVSVINAIVDELTDDGVDVPNVLVLTRHTGDEAPEGDDLFHLVIEENTVDSFAGAEIDLEFSGIPDGVTLTLDAWVATKDTYDDEDVDLMVSLADDDDVGDGPDQDLLSDQVAIGDEDDMEDTVTAEGNETTVFIGSNMFPINRGTADVPDTVTVVGGALSPTAVDVVIVRGSIDLGDDDNVEALLPLDLEILVTANVGPTGDADDVADDDGPPVFATDMTTAVTVIESTSAQTVMEVAYVLSDGPYDTGIAVSNMTKDQAGAVHFALYMNGEEMKYSTPSMMQPQSTMSLLLSEVLRMAESYRSFRGVHDHHGGLHQSRRRGFRLGFRWVYRGGYRSYVKLRDPLGPGSDPMQGRGHAPLPCCFFARCRCGGTGNIDEAFRERVRHGLGLGGGDGGRLAGREPRRPVRSCARRGAALAGHGVLASVGRGRPGRCVAVSPAGAPATFSGAPGATV